MYNSDTYRWSIEQSEAILNGDWHKVDREHVADEILSVGKTEKKELTSRLAVLIGHLLKWQHQPGKRSNSWKITIRAQREEIKDLMEENPSLKPFLEQDSIGKSYRNALSLASTETGLDNFPDECPYTIEEILDENFLP